MREFIKTSLSGIVTGQGGASQRPDGQWDVWAAYGSSWAGQVCDNGRDYGAVVEDPNAWMKSHGLEPVEVVQERDAREQAALDEDRREYARMRAACGM